MKYIWGEGALTLLTMVSPWLVVLNSQLSHGRRTDILLASFGRMFTVEADTGAVGVGGRAGVGVAPFCGGSFSEFPASLRTCMKHLFSLNTKTCWFSSTEPTAEVSLLDLMEELPGDNLCWSMYLYPAGILHENSGVEAQKICSRRWTTSGRLTKHRRKTTRLWKTPKPPIFVKRSSMLILTSTSVIQSRKKVTEKAIYKRWIELHFWALSYQVFMKYWVITLSRLPQTSI